MVSEFQKLPSYGARDGNLAHLIGRRVNKDEDTLGSRFEHSGFEIFGLVLRMLENPTMAEEKTLDESMQVWPCAAQFDGSRGKPTVWLSVLARNPALDRLRLGQHERERRGSQNMMTEEVDITGDPEPSNEDRARCRLVQQALSSLTPDQRQVIEMAFFGGLSQREIAVQLGESLGTVKTQIRLGMIKLRDSLDSIEEDLVS